MKNGYNIGISFEGSKITKLGKGVPSHEFPKAELPKTKSLPKVKLIYTGGTIGSKLDYKTGGVYMLLKPEELLYEVPELAGIADIEVEPLFSISSEDMSYHEWQKIAERVAEARKEGFRGVVVTIGTDTMHYASAALSFMLNGIGMPVVLTGAQRSSDRGSSDAFMNLYCSVVLAAKSDIAEVGICMHKNSSDDECGFILGTRARKMHTSRRDAFRPINSEYIATVSYKGEIKYGKSNYRKLNGEKQAALKTGFDKKVALIKAYPNSDPEIISHYAEKGYKGIIIEGTGLGHTPVSTEHEGYSWLPEIKKAVEKGVIVGMTSQCLYGRVNPNVYRNLRLLSGSGVVYCEDMLPETAYVKLGWLLGNFKSADAKRMLSKNVAGELKDRSLYEEFLE
ncbi:MAG: Glu-tRNA(Gln) amidotransferase subunit GatD [Candidatus Marsarchaeota archaeon]|nr:Glu-tRNA(Gln) amidotransferase subunit GatD [Candidatus Marsarchaeota archaeon]